MDEISRRTMFNIQAEGLLDDVRSHFRELNEDEGLTPEDRQRLKLEHLVTPRAQRAPSKILPRTFPRREVSRCPPEIICFAAPKQNPKAA